jgi:hypothetical protein
MCRVEGVTTTPSELLLALARKILLNEGLFLLYRYFTVDVNKPPRQANWLATPLEGNV